MSDRSNNRALVWAHSCRLCTALSPSFLPSSFPPWRKLTWCVCYVTGFLSHFPSSTEKALDVVSTSSISNTSRPSSCELPRMGPGYFLSSLVLEQSVPGSCHLSCPSPGLPSNCSSAALSHPRAGSPKFISLPLPSSILCFISLLPESCSAFITQQAPQAKGMSTSSPFHGSILFVALSNSLRTALSLLWGSCGLRRSLSTTLNRRNWNKMIPWGFSIVLVRCVCLPCYQQCFPDASSQLPVSKNLPPQS